MVRPHDERLLRNRETQLQWLRQRLGAVYGQDLVERAERLAQDGRVEIVANDDEVIGRVQDGGEVRRVFYCPDPEPHHGWQRGSRPSCDCGAPPGCLHALALALEATHRRLFGKPLAAGSGLAPAPALPAPSSAAPAPAPAASPPPAEDQAVFFTQLAGAQDRASLQAVCQALGLERHAAENCHIALDQHLAYGPARIWVRAQGARGWSLLDVLAGHPQGYPPKKGQQPPPPEVVALAQLHLSQVAAGFARARRAAAQRIAALPPPREPLLTAAWEHLRAQRAAFAADVEPAAASEHLRLTLQEDPPGVVARPPVSLCRHGWQQTVRIQLDTATGQVQVGCDCRNPPASCAARLLAVDDLLTELSTTPPTRLQQQLVRLLTQAPWERLQQRLDEALTATAAPPPDEPEEQFAWRVTLPEGGLASPDCCLGLKVEPVMLRPAKRAKGGLNVQRATRERLRQWPLELADRALLGQSFLRRYGSHATEREDALNAMRQLVGHPHVVQARGRGPVRPVTVRHGQVRLGLLDAPAGQVRLTCCTPEGQELPDGARTRLGEAAGTGLPLLLLLGEVLWVLEVPPQVAALIATLRPHADTLPAEPARELLARLLGTAQQLPLHLGAEVAGEPVPADGTVRLRLTRQPGAGLLVEPLVRPLPELGSQPAGEGPRELYALRDGVPIHAQRSLEDERQRSRELLQALGLTASGDATGQILLTLDTALDLLARLADRPPDDPPVEWGDARRLHVSRPASARNLRLRVGNGQGWFQLGGELELDGVIVPLGELLRALRERRSYIAAGQDTYLRLSAALRRDLGAAATTLRGAERNATVSRFAAPLLADLRAAGAQVDGNAEWRTVLRRLKEAETLQPAVPPELEGVLRPYQVEGFAWLVRLTHWGAGACLADDMGLGKTLQALALLLHRAPRGPALVVAPTSVVFNWGREAARFAPSLRLRTVRSGAELDALGELGPGQMVVLSYSLVARHAARQAACSFATLVLDEAQAVKNPATDRARSVAALQAEARVALTGTPVENRSGELYSLFSILLPGLLGSPESFHERFALPIERLRDEAAQQRLAALIRPFVLRRLKEEVAPELPPRIEIRRDVALGRDERARYDAVRLAALAQLAEGTGTGADAGRRRFQLLAALTRLRQLACHPRLVDPTAPPRSAKLDLLLELVAELRAEGHRALVFSQFTEQLALVREALQQHGIAHRYLDGSTPVTQRREEIDRFQQGEGELFLLSLKAGGAGINLTAADYVIFLDPWWNPAVEAQAADRAHRIGQERPVTIVRLVAQETIEEGILLLQEEKRQLVAALLEGTGSAAALTSEELLALIEGSGGWNETRDDDEEDGENGEDGERPAGEPGRGPVAASPANGGARRLIGRAPAPASPRPVASPKTLSAPAAPAVEPTPAPAAPAVEPTPAAVHARLAQTLEQAAAAGLLGEQAVRSYLRIAHRLLQTCHTRGWSLDPAALEQSVKRYVTLVRSRQADDLPASDASMAKSVLVWLQRGQDPAD